MLAQALAQTVAPSQRISGDQICFSNYGIIEAINLPISPSDKQSN